ETKAQCDLSSVTIQKVSSVPYGSGCIITFNLSFRLADANNSSNRYIYLHTWLQPNYPNYFDCSLAGNGNSSINDAPEYGDLANAFLNLGIRNTGAGAPAILTTYGPDPLVPMATASSVTRTDMADGSAFFTVL